VQHFAWGVWHTQSIMSAGQIPFFDFALSAAKGHLTESGVTASLQWSKVADPRCASRRWAPPIAGCDCCLAASLKPRRIEWLTSTGKERTDVEVAGSVQRRGD